MTTLNLKLISHARALLRNLPAIAVGCMLTCTFAASAQSQDEEPALKVHLKNGNPQIILFSTTPVMTFENDECVIESSDIDARYKMDNVDYAEILGRKSLIEDLQSSLVIDLSDRDAVVIRGMQPGGNVALYDLSGVALKFTSADDAGTAVLSLRNLSSAIYIVSTKESTFKIYRK